MITAMNSIQDMVDVNTIIGEPIETSTNVVIIPISKVTFGFAAGGSEFKGETVDEYTKKEKEEEIQYRLPFGGGSAAGVNIVPTAFLVVEEKGVKLLPVEHSSAVDRLIDYVPDLIEKVNKMIGKQLEDRKEELEKIEKKEKIVEKDEMNNKRTVETKEKKVRPAKSKKVTIQHEELPKDEIEYEVEYEEEGNMNDTINIEEYTEEEFDD